ncbi:MAG: hypothetical protein HN548_13335, partial [Opitutae bacterium]|nr:hypothetical protein [Opitutae bacterium]
MILSQNELNSCVSGKWGNPHDFLGLHSLGANKGFVARAIDPLAEEVFIINKETQDAYLLLKIHPNGLFEGKIANATSSFPYVFRSLRNEVEVEWEDPYGFLPHIQNEDLADFNQGIERRPFEKLGSFTAQNNGIDGVAFVLWAPSAQSVHVIGDFNQWNPISLPMRSLGSSGCREIFVPGATVGQKYKFRVLGADGVMRDKTDPFGSKFEGPPENASIIHSRDSGPLDRSAVSSPNLCSKPFSIYEMHL